jgi:ATP-dependent Clp protease ATP-binding subunit ClpA
VYEPFSDDARRVMQLANREAQRLNHEYIGTEHLLLGILKERPCGGARVLKQLRLDLDKLQQKVEQIIVRGTDATPLGRLPETPRAKKVVEYAILEARNLGHHEVGSEHLLLGLFREEEGVAGVVLRYQGLQLEELRNEVRGYCQAEQVRRPKPEPAPLSSLPPEVQDKIRELDSQIEQLNREKVAAVDGSDFEKAALLRDRSDRLRKQRQNIIREAQGGQQ